MEGHGQKLTGKQEALIAALLTEPSYAAAAAKAGVGHDRADPIVGQEVCPQFFANHVRGLGAGASCTYFWRVCRQR
jgi:hypothetical protein